MNILSKREYYQAIVKRYHGSNKAGRGKILDEFCQICGYNRSYASRLLNLGPKKRRKQPGRRSKYEGAEFVRALKIIWLASEQLCGRRLKESMSWYLSHYPKHHGLLEENIKELLLQISASSIDRILRKTKIKYSGRGKSLTKPGSLLRNEIPLRVNFWDVNVPGFVEADTVAHCGQSAHGPFAFTITLTDIHTTWTECRAIWTKKSDGVVEQIDDIKKSLPFDLLGFDCDNGSEFLNDHLVRYFQKKKIPLTRSRPYKKNDNAHVEQKNWTHARQLFGYLRIENPDCIVSGQTTPSLQIQIRSEWVMSEVFFPQPRGK